MTVALIAIRILRKLPHSRRFERHLDDCTALEILHTAFPSMYQALILAHVIRSIPLPDLDSCRIDMEPESLEVGIRTNQVDRGREAIKATDSRLSNDNVIKAFS